MTSTLLQPAAGVSSLDFHQLRAILPHGFPFLMLDKVTSLEPGKRIVALKNVSGNEIHFLGHFSDHALMPGVLIIEALAQALHVLDVLSRDPTTVATERASRNYLSNVNIKFIRPVFPGDQIALEAEIVKQIEHGVIANTIARVDGMVVAKGEIALFSKRILPHE